LAAQQIQTLLGRLPPEKQIPIFVFDAGYDPVELALSLGQTEAAVLVRLRAGRCFYTAPRSILWQKEARYASGVNRQEILHKGE